MREVIASADRALVLSLKQNDMDTASLYAQQSIAASLIAIARTSACDDLAERYKGQVVSISTNQGADPGVFHCLIREDTGTALVADVLSGNEKGTKLSLRAVYVRKAAIVHVWPQDWPLPDEA